MPVLQQQTPAVAETILQLFADPAQAPPHIQAAQAARQTIQKQGWTPPLGHNSGKHSRHTQQQNFSWGRHSQGGNNRL